MDLHAVITGDIVNSTKLDARQEKLLLKKLEEILSPYKYEFYRGDSFQVYIKDSSVSLTVALLCRTAAIALMPEEGTVVSDVRVSIGIGTVETPIRSLRSAKGEAFLLSGRAFDSLEKTEGRLVVVTPDNMANIACEVMSDYINSIYKQMTAKQAEVIFELLKGDTQQQVAEKLNKSKSTISQHVTAGRWDEIERILKNYKKLIELLTS
jgi:hypothetical protein